MTSLDAPLLPADVIREAAATLHTLCNDKRNTRDNEHDDACSGGAVSKHALLTSRVESVLSRWACGLLAVDMPWQPVLVEDALVDLLCSSQHDALDWSSMAADTRDFCVAALWRAAAEALFVLPDDEGSPQTLIEFSSGRLRAAERLLAADATRRSAAVRDVPGHALFALTRLRLSSVPAEVVEVCERTREHLCRMRRVSSASLCLAPPHASLLTCVRAALQHDCEQPDPSLRQHAHKLAPAAAVLHALVAPFVRAEPPRVPALADEIRPLLHQLMAHVHAPTRCAALRTLAVFPPAACNPDSLPHLRASLLWADAPTAQLALPLMASHLPPPRPPPLRSTSDETTACAKRAVATLISLMTAREGRRESASSAQTAATYARMPTDTFAQALLPISDRWLRALSAFLQRTTRLLVRGEVERHTVFEACDALSAALRVLWLRASGCQAFVLDGCIAAALELRSYSDAREVHVALRSVVQTLARCGPPAPVLRFLRELRASALPFHSLANAVAFLDELDVLVSAEDAQRRHVNAGNMIARFFPELNSGQRGHV